MISAILQDADMTFTVTLSIMSTCEKTLAKIDYQLQLNNNHIYQISEEQKVSHYESMWKSYNNITPGTAA